SLPDKELDVAIILLSRIPECCRALSETHYNKLAGYIRQGPLHIIGPLAQVAHTVPELREAVREQISTLEATELAPLIKGGLQEAAIERAVDLFCSVTNFGAANYVADNLVLPILTHLKLEHITRIIKAPSEEKADLRGSYGFSGFLSAVRKEKVIAPEVLDELLKENNMKVYMLSKDDDGGDLPF
ncbi:MAG: hypothetical protein J2P49_10275, partial [Methylocapsa sp.]|nr:hypothetical protein [Methylocapsa sp.]